MQTAVGRQSSHQLQPGAHPTGFSPGAWYLKGRLELVDHVSSLIARYMSAWLYTYCSCRQEVILYPTTPSQGHVQPTLSHVSCILNADCVRGTTSKDIFYPVKVPLKPSISLHLSPTLFKPSRFLWRTLKLCHHAVLYCPPCSPHGIPQILHGGLWAPIPLINWSFWCYQWWLCWCLCWWQAYQLSNGIQLVPYVAMAFQV